ncbi:thioredoxin-like protein [Aaosphaeria arxii CBS 175.79]|uniref:Thioredoxin-like protein n=1 Tax=Aaosphaeria arxii CBS 175.79 TaxID=1450172 RepID=A0A6A5XJR8_9PLEO|nr:thioredoxin-like protein [Aaosphaeria arxii CBS 175.79]KAF2012554.1 thioredoxin-like protein [Aaosphaeria arxii CBS 175.79]
MAELDPKVAAVLDKANRGGDESDEDALIAALEDDSELDAFREQRLQQLHAEYDRARHLRASDHGTYVEIKEEKALMDITTSTKKCVVHFFKPDFNRCRIMDSHLESLAPAHYEARILKINVDNAPFLVTKLKIQVLPCVIAFIDGIGVDRVIGFEGLGRTPDSFTTRDLESRLIRANVLVRSKVNQEDERERKENQKRRQNMDNDDDDDDWD